VAHHADLLVHETLYEVDTLVTALELDGLCATFFYET
jgi:hypothetical protein